MMAFGRGSVMQFKIVVQKISASGMIEDHGSVYKLLRHTMSRPLLHVFRSVAHMR